MPGTAPPGGAQVLCAGLAGQAAHAADVCTATQCPPCVQVARVQKMLADEYGTASNIKSRVNRLSVLSAITSAQQRLKLYNRVREMLRHCLPQRAVAAAHTLLGRSRTWIMC